MWFRILWSEDHKLSPEYSIKSTNGENLSELKPERRGKNECGEWRRKEQDGAATSQGSGQPQSLIDLLRWSGLWIGSPLDDRQITNGAGEGVLGY